MEKVDFKKSLKELYGARKNKPALIDVPAMNFAMIDGAGAPSESQSFQEAIETLYGVSFTLKFTFKQSEEPYDWVVPPLEGLWWMAGGAEFDMTKKDQLLWTLMIMQPERITQVDFDRACSDLRKKKDPPALSKVRLEQFVEGRAAQILHIGPYDTEEPTLKTLHLFIASEGLMPTGKHHEIYLADPRRTKPEKLKTILRQPVG